MSIVNAGIDLSQAQNGMNAVALEKRNSMHKDLPFNTHTAEYDSWFDQHPGVFKSELAAIRQAWPDGNNLMSLEIGSGTGRFAEALQITEGIEPAANMNAVAEKRGVNTLSGIAEDLPYGDLEFDVVLMNCCISYLQDPDRALEEVYRVLKYGGCLLLGFIDRNSPIGKYYENKRAYSVFYRNAVFYSAEQVEEKLRNAGFRQMSFSQTLFHSLNDTDLPEPVKSGFGEGSYVLVKTIKMPLPVS